MKYRFDQIGSDFKCIHCRQIVSTDPMLSGVNNRNHCPYCLHSRHLDLYQAGDRLSACREAMLPVGLTMKRTNKKYGRGHGELMLIHQCTGCGGVSINRIAADDDPETIYRIYTQSLALDPAARTLIEASGIQFLDAYEEESIRLQLFGWRDCAAPTYA